MTPETEEAPSSSVTGMPPWDTFSGDHLTSALQRLFFFLKNKELSVTIVSMLNNDFLELFQDSMSYMINIYSFTN